MAKTYTEIGELRKNEDEGIKGQPGFKEGSLYLKIYIRPKDGGKIIMNSGDTIKLEDPKLKFQRIIDSGKAEDVDKLIEERDNIPAYVKRRATLVQEK